MLPDEYTLPRNAVRCEPPLQGPGSTDFDEFVPVTWTNPASLPNFRPIAPREVVRELMRYERQRRSRRIRFALLVLFTITAVAVAVLQAFP